MKTEFSIFPLPFWNYAVVPHSNFAPGIPFYRLKSARELFEKAKRELPWAGVYLVRRNFFGKIEVLERYGGSPIMVLPDDVDELFIEEALKGQPIQIIPDGVEPIMIVDVIECPHCHADNAITDRVCWACNQTLVNEK